MFPKKKTVKEYNERQLSLVEEELVVLQAINVLSTRSHFDPYVDESDGKVRNTPLTNVLYLKKGARVILIQNIDVTDSLNNGAKGTVVDFLKPSDAVTHVIVEFDNKDAGQKLGQSQTDTFLCLYERGVPISKLNFTYSINKRKHEKGQKAVCIQFPLQLGYALTIHKIQGATIKPPRTLTSSFRDILKRTLSKAE